MRSILMHPTRILISVKHRLPRQLIQYSLDRQSHVEIVGRTTKAIEILTMILEREPHVWIHSFDDSPRFCKLRRLIHRLAPELIEVRMSSAEQSGYLQLPIRSVDELVDETLRVRRAAVVVSSL